MIMFGCTYLENRIGWEMLTENDAINEGGVERTFKWLDQVIVIDMSKCG